MSLKVKSGGIMALIGPSGCGKTSFLTCLNRLVERERGCKVSGASYWEIRMQAPMISLRRRWNAQNPTRFRSPLSEISNFSGNTG